MKLSDIHKDCQRKLASAMRETYSDADSIIDYSFATFFEPSNVPVLGLLGFPCP